MINAVIHVGIADIDKQFIYGDVDVVSHAPGEVELLITSGERKDEELTVIVTMSAADAANLLSDLDSITVGGN